WGQLADDQLSADRSVTQHGNRRLTTATTFGGALHIDGLLDAEGGALFDAAIDKLSPPDPKDTPGGPRAAAQRRADALVQMARIVLGGGEATGVSPTNVNVLVDFGTLDSYGSSGSLVDSRCDLDWTGPIGRETLLRLGCDCSVSRIVMKGRSEVLDMGRKTRLVTPVQRRALSVRDGGCVFPGCDRPDSWCDAHHLIHWVLGGNTDLCDLCLLCRRHHVMVHEGGWTLSKLPGGGFQARAPDE
ncbi:MAG: DUF222 domain-containing protein, partial [Acidimicrobiia bacterium]|nr:DUF222 domain-containing protein [Acidimicrobiia bacterium]